MLPIVLNLQGRLAVVVGGGAVGRRKARAVLHAGGRVRLVCREPRPAGENTAALEWLQADYQACHLEGASLVFAAATPAVNAQVVADAQARGLWVNSATAPGQGDFFLPACVPCGPLLVAVSSQGLAPAAARTLCRWLAAQVDETVHQWIALLGALRSQVQAEIADAAQRRRLLRRWSQPLWLERLRRQGVTAVRQALLAELAAARQKQPPSPESQ